MATPFCAHTTATLGAATYRFDFYDMNDAVCGDAAAAMDVPALAAASAGLIKTDINSPGGGRPRMPPAPAPVLADWERETISRWADAPIKGPPDPGNRLPAAQQAADHEGLFHRTTRRMEIDRSLRVFDIPQETTNARGGVISS